MHYPTCWISSSSRRLLGRTTARWDGGGDASEVRAAVPLGIAAGGVACCPLPIADPLATPHAPFLSTGILLQPLPQPAGRRRPGHRDRCPRTRDARASPVVAQRSAACQHCTSAPYPASITPRPCTLPRTAPRPPAPAAQTSTPIKSCATTCWGRRRTRMPWCGLTRSTPRGCAGQR